MSKHTPGPWEVRECNHGGGLLIRGNDRNHPQSMLQIVPMADARLIAAAPELLEALRALVEHRELADLKRGQLFELVQEARAALAKANGGSAND